MSDVLLINGPNLARLGQRAPSIYGHVTLRQIEEKVHHRVEAAGLSLKCFQSDVEGEIIRFVDAHRDARGLIINPGALMMSGWSLRDCLEDFDGYKIEIHISNIFAREAFRTRSVLADVMNGMIAGLGVVAYTLAVSAIEAVIRPETAGAK
ncbi:type II 3-dehydroquinate dehydratase [Bradyrhizobium liaoningense]|uniref:type II 3-dehydroquinate dehydratase n=1 Tax=Bradyrhizobium liaoningense TaxID=43992 RepID=UPI001BAE0416|nr:type II 3-dehydroquinate dehydratase [Bradyrhizobium liaoningense]MBR0838844.1 type II 3-dehydroquinate dehydratase [Bradyrhizobium liaoningense]